MIVWIASYPRSGNTLARSILHRCFGLESYSIYDEIEFEEMAPVVGHRPLGMTDDAFVAMARASSETFFIKTHHMPPDQDDRAIHIVRDGRAALSSYRQYLATVRGQEFPLEYLALGTWPLAVWSDHVTAWSARPARLQLNLRFEQLTQPGRDVLAKISRFIGRPVLRDYDVSFAQLHALQPQFYSVGQNARGIAEIESTCPAIFWGVHGKAMRKLGYGPWRRPHPQLPAKTIAELRRTVLRTREQAPKLEPKA